MVRSGTNIKGRRSVSPDPSRGGNEMFKALRLVGRTHFLYHDCLAIHLAIDRNLVAEHILHGIGVGDLINLSARTGSELLRSVESGEDDQPLSSAVGQVGVEVDVRVPGVANV
jgi:hypothetical protein